MAEKLTESTWTGFKKKQKFEIDDGPLVKALARFDKTDEAKPEPRLEALEDLIEQVKKQVVALAKRKKELGDKLFGEIKDKLYELLDGAEKIQQATQVALAKAKADADEEEESPALLTSKLIPLIREVRKGELTLQALIALAGKETVVLLSRKSISPARGKLLKEQMTNPSGLKFIRGECQWAENTLTFVVQSPAAGLAKRIKAALLLQVELRLNVRVRGEDGEEDQERDADEPAEAQADIGSDPAQGRYLARRKELEPRVAEALRAQAGDVSKIRAVSAFAFEKGDQRLYPAALQALDALEKLLGSGAAPVGTTAATAAPAAPAAGNSSAAPAAAPAGAADAAALRARLAALGPRIKQAAADKAPYADAALRGVASYQDHLKAGRLEEARQALDEVQALLGAAGGTRAPGGAVDYAKARLAWVAARNNAKADLRRLETAILDAYADEPAMLAQITKGVRRLDKVLVRLDTSLADKLDEGLNAAEPQARAQVNREALGIIDKYIAFLDSDPLIENIDDNPFVDMDLASTLGETLAGLAEQLA
jgi:hypothetical protein